MVSAGVCKCHSVFLGIFAAIFVFPLWLSALLFAFLLFNFPRQKQPNGCAGADDDVVGCVIQKSSHRSHVCRRNWRPDQAEHTFQSVASLTSG